MKKTNLVSAITLSGKLTIAHLLIVLKPLLQKQKQYHLFLFLADLHALTTNKNPQSLLQLRDQTGSFLYAIGFEKENVFLQSSIHGHTFLTYILGCFANIGQLERMTQFKDRKKDHSNKDINLGLLNYPLLMASDILLYDGDVLIGNDQKQHLELTRDLALTLNKKYHSDLFHLPQIIKHDYYQYRIRSLKNPHKKMSKSSQDFNSIIFLDDSQEQVKSKIRSCQTDGENKIYFDFEKKPGISNLILIYSLCCDLSIEEGEKQLQQKCHDYLQLKNIVAEKINSVLEPLQQKQQYFLKSNQYQKYLKMGNIRAQNVVDQKIKKIQATLKVRFLD